MNDNGNGFVLVPFVQLAAPVRLWRAVNWLGGGWIGRLLPLIFVLLVPSLEARAQPSFHRTLFTSASGLKESWANAVSAGPTGRVWVSHGAIGEISVYDGYRFEFRPSPGNRWAFGQLTVREGLSGQPWALLLDSQMKKILGLQVLQGADWKAHEIPGLVHLEIGEQTQFLPLGHDQVLLALPDRLVEYRARERTLVVRKQAGESGLGKFTALSRGVDGNLWIAGARGCAKVEIPKSGTAGAGWKELLLPPGLGVKEILAVHESQAGQIFATALSARGAGQLLLRHADGQWNLAGQTKEPHLRIAGWSAPGQGYWRLIRTPFTWEQGELPSNQQAFFTLTELEGSAEYPLRDRKELAGLLNGVAVEPGGAFWLATSLGLARYAPLPWRKVDLPFESSGIANSLIEDARASLWVLQDRWLIVRRPSGWRRFEIPAGFVPARYRTGAVAALPDGRLAIGTTGNGLLLFDPKVDRFSVMSPPDQATSSRWVRILGRTRQGLAWTIWRASNGETVAGSFDGVLFSEQFRVAKGHSLDEFTQILETQQGEIWIGLQTQDGLARVRNGRAERLEGSPRGVFSLIESSPGRLWVGDRDRIQEFDGSNWTALQTGLETVRTLSRSRDGSIWAATGAGLLRYRDGSWLSITPAEGLPDAAVFTVYEDGAGTIWAGTSEGLVVYEPSADPNPPETEIAESDNLRETAPHGEVRLIFSGSDRYEQTPSDRLVFSHRLDDNPWSPFSPVKVASYDGLPFGHHRFEVRAMDRNWNVDPSPAEFSFDVMPAWYQTANFQLLAAFGVLAILFLLALHWSNYRRLERLVAVRTADLQAANQTLVRDMEERKALQERLFLSQKMQAIGLLAGGVAHDFNNLLTVIIGYADALRMSGSGGSTPVYAKEILGAAQRAAELTRQLLALGRKQMLEPRVVDLNALVRDVFPMLKGLIREDIDLRFVPEAGLGSVRVDPGQIEQVLVNMVANARDAMPQGGVLTIETRNELLDGTEAPGEDVVQPGSYAMLSVSDTGIGMTPETMRQIFQPFFTTKETGKGTGLGLATAYGIVKQSGGHIAVSSEPGQGSVFRVYLPVTQERPPARTRAETGLRSAQLEAGPATVLIAEDRDELRALAEHVLAANGYTVLTAANGEEAFAIARQRGATIDLLLTDVVMPGDNGLELARRVREIHPSIRVLYMTGYMDQGVLEQGPVDPGAALLPKPFSPDALLRKVREVLRPQSPGAAAAGTMS